LTQQGTDLFSIYIGNKSAPFRFYAFTLLPNIDTETLLSHACETLASLNVLATDFACELEGSHRSLALSIQQLAVLGELLVNRALDNLDPPSVDQQGRDRAIDAGNRHVSSHGCERNFKSSIKNGRPRVGSPIFISEIFNSASQAYARSTSQEFVKNCL
jgi:hypothetical protein